MLHAKRVSTIQKVWKKISGCFAPVPQQGCPVATGSLPTYPASPRPPAVFCCSCFMLTLWEIQSSIQEMARAIGA